MTVFLKYWNKVRVGEMWDFMAKIDEKAPFSNARKNTVLVFDKLNNDNCVIFGKIG